jgi:hypothetical protein
LLIFFHVRGKNIHMLNYKINHNSASSFSGVAAQQRRTGPSRGIREANQLGDFVGELGGSGPFSQLIGRLRTLNRCERPPGGSIILLTNNADLPRIFRIMHSWGFLTQF